MKNKLKKIFVFGSLLISGALTLSACLAPRDSKKDYDGDGDGEGGETVKNNFPTQELRTFLTSQQIDCVVPVPVSEGTWTTQIIENELTGLKTFEAKVEDNGTIGVDSIEDTYLATIKATSGWTVDESYYEENGYFADNTLVDIQFFTDKDEDGKGEFYFYATKIEGSGDETLVSDEFPAAYLKAFLTGLGISTVVPSPVSANEWHYGSDEESGTSYFFASTDDAGTIGVNSIEDTYTSLLTANGWVVDDSAYESVGYYANKDDVEMIYYSYEGSFSILVYKASSSDMSESDVFPATELQAFLDEQGLKTAVPSPTSSNSWSYIASEDEDGPYFFAGTEDKGTIGVNSIEDTYTTLLTANGWTIDDTFYEDDGYYANKGDVEILYYTYEDEFDMYVYAGEGGEITPTPVDGEWTLVTSVSDLAEGDVIVIGESSKGVVLSGDITGGSNKYFEPADATFADGTISSLPATATQFTLGKNGNYWTLSSDGQLLGATADKKVAWDSGVTNWSISISSEGATIQNATSDYGRFLYNVSSPRFTNYKPSTATSATMLLPQIYKYGGEGGGTTPVTPEPKEKAAWTIMVYMCGSDLESKSGYATKDIAEMLSVSNQPDDVNIIIETGGATSWKKYNISAKNLTRYHVENKQLVKDATLSDASMGAQGTFESFLEWGLTYYPADKVGVILWNHGGAMGGVCSDDNHKGDTLLNSETKAAFDKVLDDGQKLEFIGYDACLMQVQDIADFNSSYFNYMVASEESEAGEGWDYSAWVDDLYAKKPTETILKAICDGFIADYEATYGQQYANDQTLSYLDLSKMAAYREAFETLAASMKDIIKTKAFSDFMLTVKNYGDTYLDEEEYEEYLEYYEPYMFDQGMDQGEVYYLLHGYYDFGSFDVKDFLTKLSNNTTLGVNKTNVTNALNALNQVISYNTVGDEAGESHGLAFICPMDEYVCTNFYSSNSETNFVTWRAAVSGTRVYPS